MTSIKAIAQEQQNQDMQDPRMGPFTKYRPRLWQAHRCIPGVDYVTSAT